MPDPTDVTADIGGLNVLSTYNRGQQGVFAEYPLMTPKYAVNAGLRDNEFRDTLARFYISLNGADPNAVANYLASVPPEALALAKVLVGSTSGKGTGFIDFFLQQVTESFNEVAQVDKVLADNYVAFFFGQEPPIFQFSGTLLNSVQDDQRLGMALAYQHLIRGTQLARRGALLRVRYDSVIISGAIMNMTQTLNAENELVVPFSFSLLVKEYLIFQQPQNIVTKVQDPFGPADILNAIGAISNVSSQTVAVTSKLSKESVAGADENAPTVATTPQGLSQAAKDLLTASVANPDVAPGQIVKPSAPPTPFAVAAEGLFTSSGQ
jgi:hypothetical protein